MEKQKNNSFVNILVNIVIPVIVLSKFSKEEYLGPVYGLVIALSLPLIYGIYELIIQKKRNFISVIGFVGILLTGAIGLLHLPLHLIAIKEAAIPLLIGIVVLISTKTSWQLIRKFIYNRELLNIDLIESKLSTSSSLDQLNTILTRANIFFASSFFISSVLNFVLAKVIVHSNPGTPNFNEEMGRMTMLSFPVIVVPSLIIMLLVLWYLFAKLKGLTQLNSDQLFSEKIKS